MTLFKWAKVRLGDRCSKIGSGSTPRGGEQVYQSEGTAFIRSQNVYNGRFTTSGLAFLGDDEAQRLSGVTVQSGDILLNITGDSVARCCQVPETVLPARVSQHVSIIRPDPSEFDPTFLAYFFISPWMQSTMLSLAGSGGTRKALTKEMIEGFDVPKPELRIQKRIGEFLAVYDGLIENNRRRIALLAESARLLYREWLVFLRFPGHEHTRIVNGLPEGWARITVGDYIERGNVHLQTGPFGTQLRASDYVESGTPVINVRNIGYGDLRPDKLEFVPEEVVDRLQVHVLQIGDIVFGRKGAVDRHLLIGSEQSGWMQGSDCIRLRTLSDSVCSLFLSFTFREEGHRQWMLNQCGNKATMASLNQDVIARIPVLEPSPGLLREYREFANSILAQIELLQRQADLAVRARDLLLPSLMSGEIPV